MKAIKGEEEIGVPENAIKRIEDGKDGGNVLSGR